LASFSKKKMIKKMMNVFHKSLIEDESEELWGREAEKAVESIYGGLLSCLEDDLYLQEFMPFGSLYRMAGELAIKRRNRSIPAEKVLQEHILLRDAFWEFRRSMPEKVHDFFTEKRLCQCFNGLLQATVLAYQTSEPVMDVMDPLRDQLTGVFNERYFITRLDEEILRGQRYLRDVTIALFRVDYAFEPDSSQEVELMRAMTRVLRRNSRASDVLARLDRGKFGVIFPETKLEDTTMVATRLKEQIIEYLASLGGPGPFGQVNIELGLSSYPQHGDEGPVLVEEAEQRIRGEETGSA